MRQAVYLVGFEEEDFGALYNLLYKMTGLWPFIFPEEEWYWHIIMLTQGECNSYYDYWNFGGTPRFDHIDTRFYPSTRQFDQLCNVSGYWFVFKDNPPGGAKPGRLRQRLDCYTPITFWHEFCHALGCDIGQADYNTIHSNSLYHCGAVGWKSYGDCPQMGGTGDGLCYSSICVRCRACASRYTGKKTNIRQTMAEHKWFEDTFVRPYKCWHSADMSGQMSNVQGYDYDRFPLQYWTWQHNLSWYYAQAVDESVRPVHLIFERTIGGDGIPTEVFTAEHPDYIFDPVSVTIKGDGFLAVTPTIAKIGDTLTAQTLGEAGIAISGATVKRNGTVVGVTDSNGHLIMTA